MVVLAVVVVGVASGDQGVVGECWGVNGVGCSDSNGDRGNSGGGVREVW